MYSTAVIPLPWLTSLTLLSGSCVHHTSTQLVNTTLCLMTYVCCGLIRLTHHRPHTCKLTMFSVQYYERMLNSFFFHKKWSWGEIQLIIDDQFAAVAANAQSQPVVPVVDDMAIPACSQPIHHTCTHAAVCKLLRLPVLLQSVTYHVHARHAACAITSSWL